MTTGLVIALSVIITIVPSLVVYAWYGLALSQVFPKLGAAAWKGWVPVLNEAEILARGGEHAWKVVLAFIPIAQFYWLYVKVLAVHRINTQFGRGTGSTVLGVLLPPVWASMLAWGHTPDSNEFERRVAIGLPTPGPAAPVLSAPAPAPTGPLSDHDIPAPTPAPSAAQQWAPATAQSAVPLVAPASVAPPAPPAAPPVTPEVASAGAAMPIPPLPAQTVPAQTGPAQTVPVLLAPARVAAPAPVDDDLDRTVVVDRAPQLRWSLVLDNGAVLPITADTVALGRNPVAGPGTQALTVPDETRTLSKTHARLVLDEGEWSIVDLDSTNGVVVVDERGTETIIPPNVATRLPGSFILGEVGMRLRFEERTR